MAFRRVANLTFRFRYIFRKILYLKKSTNKTIQIMNYPKLTEVIFLRDKLFLSEVFFPHKSYRISMSVILPQNFGNINE